MKKLKGIAKVQMAKLRRCYVYEIRVDGVIRYIGKGCNDRINSHLIEARRTASRSEVKIRNLSPHFRKMLVSAVRRGAIITEKIISAKLTDAEAYAMEWQMIWDYHKRHAGQLWNTIDERGRNPEDLPKQWSNPVYPLYRLPRPFISRLTAQYRLLNLKQGLELDTRAHQYTSCPIRVAAANSPATEGSD